MDEINLLEDGRLGELDQSIQKAMDEQRVILPAEITDVEVGNLGDEPKHILGQIQFQIVQFNCNTRLPRS